MVSNTKAAAFTLIETCILSYNKYQRKYELLCEKKNRIRRNHQLLLQNSASFLTMVCLTQNSRPHLNPHGTYRFIRNKTELLLQLRACGFLTFSLSVTITWACRHLWTYSSTGPGNALLAHHEFLEFVSSSSESDNEGLCRPCLKIIPSLRHKKIKNNRHRMQSWF